MTVFFLIASAMLGCSETRMRRSTTSLDVARAADEQRTLDETGDILGRMVASVKKDRDDFEAGRRREPPAFDILIVSGGGDLGAFGAGFLRGWGRVEGPMARPRFTVVSGVSTGALIAPFAFLGDEASYARVESLYRHPKSDWVVLRLPLWFLPSNISFATVPGLERELRTTMGRERIARIAEGGRDGRMLVVNTTNVDDGSPRVWDLVAECARAVRTGDTDRVHRIMLASAGIPGAFPHRMIDGAMHVDGGVTGNIIHGGRLREHQTHLALWVAAYPGVPIPKTRYWVLLNNQVRGVPRVVEPTWPAVVARSVFLAIRSATLTSVRHLFAQAEIARLRYGATVEVRLAAIPDGWEAATPRPFVAETMNGLADLGERLGEDPCSWSIVAPR